MLDNLFVTAPTVGSHDNNPTSLTEELVAQVQNLERRVQNLEEQFPKKGQPHHEDARYREQPKRNDIRWGKLEKFFTAVIKPILNFLPNIINAVANLKKAAVPVRS